MQKKHYLLCAALIIIPICTVTFFTVYAFWDKCEKSSKENRYLAKCPEYNAEAWFDGKYEAGLEAFLNDHVYRRDDVIDAAANFETLLKKKQAVQMTKSTRERKDIGTDALILEDRILALYINNDDITNELIKTCRKLYDIIPEKLEKYIMISPTRIEFEEEEYKQYSDSQGDVIFKIYAGMPKDVKAIDSYLLMKSAVGTFGTDRLYFRTDHHWTELGASFGANALLSAMGKNLVNPLMYEEVNQGSFYGYLAVMHNTNSDEMLPDEFIYYKNAEDIYEDAYGVEGADISQCIHEKLVEPSRAGYYTFVERSYQYVVVEGKTKGGGNLLMVNDSYGNALVPWIAEQYENIIMVDPRCFTGGKKKLLDIVKEYKVDSFIINLAGLIPGSTFAGDMEKLCK